MNNLGYTPTNAIMTNVHANCKDYKPLAPENSYSAAFEAHERIFNHMARLYMSCLPRQEPLFKENCKNPYSMRVGDDKQPTQRDKLRRLIDEILEKKTADLDAFIAALHDAGCSRADAESVAQCAHTALL